MFWVVRVFWEKGVVWGFARLEGVLPKIPILKKVRKVPEVRAGGLVKGGVEDASYRHSALLALRAKSLAALGSPLSQLR